MKDSPKTRGGEGRLDSVFLKGLGGPKQVGLKKLDGGLNKNGGPQGF